MASLAAMPALAHRGETVRTLRLQRGENGFEGLISIAVPPGLQAQALLVAPGLVPGERPDASLGDLIGRRAAAAALRGLHVSIGADQGPVRPMAIEVIESNARRTRTGGIEGMALLRLKGGLPSGAAVLEIDTPSGPRLRATLSAPEGQEVTLLAGVGRKAAGGVLLRPRPGKPCRARIAPKIIK